MRASVRKSGKSAGVIATKPILMEAGLSVARVEWAEASRAIAMSGDDALVWPEFANADDVTLEW